MMITRMRMIITETTTIFVMVMDVLTKHAIVKATVKSCYNFKIPTKMISMPMPKKT